MQETLDPRTLPGTCLDERHYLRERSSGLANW